MATVRCSQKKYATSQGTDTQVVNPGPD